MRLPIAGTTREIALGPANRAIAIAAPYPSPASGPSGTASDASGTWNLGTGVETSVNDLYDRIAAELGYREPAERVPLPPGEQRRSVLDSSAATKDFDLPPWTPLADGLKITADFFRKASKS